MLTPLAPPSQVLDMLGDRFPIDELVTGSVVLSDGTEIWRDFDRSQGGWSLRRHPGDEEYGVDELTGVRLAGSLTMVYLRQLVRGADGTTESIPEPAPEPVEVEPLPDPGARWLTTVQAARVLNVSRANLDRMRDRAPRTLPGSPVQGGGGKERKHWKWDRERLDVWSAAYTEWLATRGRKAPRR